MIGVRFRYIWPVALISLGLSGLCVVTAVSLLREQYTIAVVLRENVEGRRAAVELEECLTDLVALEQDKVESLDTMHDRARIHLNEIRQLADDPSEREMSANLDITFAEYLERWKMAPPVGTPEHELHIREASRFLDSHVLKRCQEFRLYKGRELEETSDRHERILGQLAWGMAGVGTLGGAAGLFLGFGVARGLTRSIKRLHVQIRDAAGKLEPELPAIVVSGEGDFHNLYEQVNRLTERIEVVVNRLQQREREVLRNEQLAAVGQLAAGVAHEIRNPLTSIKMLVQCGLEEERLEQRDLQIIESEIRRMELSLQRFLDFARPPKPERKRFTILDEVQSVVELVRGRANKQHVKIQIETSDSLRKQVGDPGLIRQAIVNLMLNALDAMPSGGTIRISQRVTAIGGVAVEVADTGPGIAEEILPRLFQPFVSGKDTGLGLGLVITRRILEDHGGSISGANRPGGGAVFTLFLPPRR